MTAKDGISDRRTDRLLLSALDASDLSAIEAMHRNPEVMATLGGVRSAADTEAFVRDTVRHWQEYGFGLWVIRSRDSNQFMGRGGLRHTVVAGRNEVEVAYALMPQFWGHGFATELARESICMGFRELRLSELVAFTQVTNHRSRRVLEKAGFRCEREFVRLHTPHILYRIGEGPVETG